MLPTIPALRGQLATVIADKARQGHVTDTLEDELASLPDSHDALVALADLPMRDDCPYVEPNDLDAIGAECDPTRPLGAITEVDLDDSARRVEAAFLGSVAGCILGMPLEINPTLAQIRTALESVGEWPMTDYISERAGDALPRWHRSWPETVRERIAYVATAGSLLGAYFGPGRLEDRWLAPSTTSTPPSPGSTNAPSQPSRNAWPTSPPSSPPSSKPPRNPGAGLWCVAIRTPAPQPTLTTHDSGDLWLPRHQPGAPIRKTFSVGNDTRPAATAAGT